MSPKKLIFSIALVSVLSASVLYRFSGFSPVRASPYVGLLKEATPTEILDHARGLNARLVLINFWASWCEPCKQEFPSLIQAKLEFESRGLRVIFVSVDDPSDAGAAVQFLKNQNVSFPTFYKGNQSLNFVAQIFPTWSGAIPATVLMDESLRLVDAWEGDTSFKELELRIKKQLKGT